MNTATSKQIIVVGTLINGRINFIAGGMSKHSFNGKWIVNHTTDLQAYGKEFNSIKEAEEFIPTIHNPHERHYQVTTETIEFKTKKEFRDYERIL